MRIILLNGWSQSGKDTAADILVKSHGFRKYAFADPLKDFASELIGFPREWADSLEGKQKTWLYGYKHETIRTILLDLALKDKAQFGEHIYASHILEKIQNLQDPQAKIVISDLRFPIELHAVSTFCKEHGSRFEVWRVVRAGQLTSPVKDISEHYFDGLAGTKVLVNPASGFEEYAKNIESLLRE